MFVLLPWITCIAVALTSIGCRPMYISFNLGAKLDTIGKAVPEAHDFRYYRLDGKTTLNAKFATEVSTFPRWAANFLTCTPWMSMANCPGI